MLFEYVQKVVEKARYKQLDDGLWFAEIPGFAGVWSQGRTVESCRKELQDVLEEWNVLKLRDCDPLPQIRARPDVPGRADARSGKKPGCIPGDVILGTNGRAEER